MVGVQQSGGAVARQSPGNLSHATVDALARPILALPAWQAQSEHTFSAAGLIVNDKPSSWKPATWNSYSSVRVQRVKHR